jgi:hypothetical protein
MRNIQDITKENGRLSLLNQIYYLQNIFWQQENGATKLPSHRNDV